MFVGGWVLCVVWFADLLYGVSFTVSIGFSSVVIWGRERARVSVEVRRRNVLRVVPESLEECAGLEKL